MTRLDALRSRPERLVVGLNSGTSCDGIDAVLVRFTGEARDATRHEILAFAKSAFSPPLRARLQGMAVANAAELCELHVELGRAFARAALALAGGRTIDLIGSHGQTVWHRPARDAGDLGATLQLGCAATIAAATGAVVASDFRADDVAAGGQGAPLVPFLDHLLFASRPGSLLLNLGGIANVTLVSAALADVVAFDTGPANMPLDLLVAEMSEGACAHDDGGRMAAAGRVDDHVLARLLEHPYLRLPPPKSTGRELFGAGFLADARAIEPRLSPVDLLATLTAFSAAAACDAIDRFLGRRRVTAVIASGGGVHNATLMRELAWRLDPIPVTTTTDVGIDAEAKEALLFAVLANERLFERPANVPSATGARGEALLGSLRW